MKFMVIVKANKDSEAGIMPSREILTAMGKYNEELVKAGVMLAGEGLHPSSKASESSSREENTPYRWAIRRNQGTDRRLLVVAGEVDGRGSRVVEAQSF